MDKVLLHMDVGALTWRQVCRGVSAYRQHHGLDWELVVARDDADLRPAWSFAGVVSVIFTESDRKWASRFGATVVAVTPDGTGHGLPVVAFDAVAAGAQAADYLRRRHFERFGYYGQDGVVQNLRRRGFISAVGGFPLIELLGRLLLTDMNEAELVAARSEHRPKLRAFVQQLADAEEPVGVLAANQYAAKALIVELLEAGVAVPDKVAVCCVSDDDLLCETAPVPITAVMANGERIGWLAAEQLYLRLSGRAGRATTLVPPKGLVERRSTETVAVADKLVASAVARLRERIADPPDSRQLAAYLGVSVRTLEGHFKRELRETPYQYQLRLRIDHAKALLRETHKTNMEIALASGFRSETRFEQAFKRITGRRPSEYRQEEG